MWKNKYHLLFWAGTVLGLVGYPSVFHMLCLHFIRSGDISGIKFQQAGHIVAVSRGELLGFCILLLNAIICSQLIFTWSACRASDSPHEKKPVNLNDNSNREA